MNNERGGQTRRPASRNTGTRTAGSRTSSSRTAGTRSTSTRSAGGMRTQAQAASRGTGSSATARSRSAAARRRQQARIRRNRITLAVLVLIVIVIFVLIIRAITGAIRSNAAADTSTITFNADGSLVFEEVVAFDSELYSKKDMKTQTRQLVTDYDDANGDDAIVLNKLNVKNDTAYVKSTYATVADYVSFTGYDTYMGTVDNASSQGYSFEDSFAQVYDGQKLDAIESDGADTFSGYSVVIVRENVTVKVPGTIAYVSNANTELTDASTVIISDGRDNNDDVNQVYIIYTPDEQ